MQNTMDLGEEGEGGEVVRGGRVHGYLPWTSKDKASCDENLEKRKEKASKR